MANYSKIKGVQYSRWDGEGDEPLVNDEGAELEEMYVESGQLWVSVSTMEGFISLQIPIVPRQSWNKFKRSLPSWEIP